MKMLSYMVQIKLKRDCGPAKTTFFLPNSCFLCSLFCKSNKISAVYNSIISHIHLHLLLSLGGAVLATLIITIGLVSLFLSNALNSFIECGTDDEANRKLIRIGGVTSVHMEFNDLHASKASREVESRKYRPQLTMAILILAATHWHEFMFMLQDTWFWK